MNLHLNGCVALLAAMLAGAGDISLPPPQHIEEAQEAPAAAPCSTSQVTISFDFEGASPSRCTIDGERAFSIVIAPEHAPPINSSPWYAFRYAAQGDAPVTVRLRYLVTEHRYDPKLTDASGTSELPADLSDDGRTATMVLPASGGIVSAQPLLGQAYYDAVLERLALRADTQRIELGRSHDGRAVEALHIGDAAAPRLIILLGRQHPPEVTGAYAMEPFLEGLLAQLDRNPAERAQFQILAVPLLNPDGVARGHWRANVGGRDINRDWGAWTQPETSAVRDWLAAVPEDVRPVIMLDFHSTQRNLFYVQGDEASRSQRRFLEAWLEGKEEQFPGYAFTIERRNANPGSGTSKNWFHATYDIPAFTYEAGDRAEAVATGQAARQLAADLADILIAQE